MTHVRKDQTNYLNKLKNKRNEYIKKQFNQTGEL